MLDKSVTVVIPFYNVDTYLHETLLSVQKNEQYISSVVIIEDIGSSKAPSYKDISLPIRHISNQTGQKGAGVCRFIGFEEAKTRYVAFLDADDIWHPDKLERQIKFMHDKKVGFSFHSFRHLDVGGRTKEVVVNGPFNLHRFLAKKFIICCSSVVVDKIKVTDVRPNTLKRRNDYRMWFDIITFCEKHNIRFEGFDFVGIHHRLHDKALTRSKIKAVFYQWVFYRSIGLTLFKSAVYMIPYLLNTIRSRMK